MGGSLKILLSLQSHFLDIGLVKFKLFSTVPFVCLWPRRGAEATADIPAPSSQVAHFLSHESDDHFNLLRTRHEKILSLDIFKNHPGTWPSA